MIIRLFFIGLLAVCLGSWAQAADLSATYPQLRSIFPQAEGYGDFEGSPPSAAVLQGGKTIGYAFLTDDVLRIPAYSGKPINVLVGLDLAGRIAGLAIVDHDEPILAVGITHERLARYAAQYQGKNAFDKVIIGASRPGHIAVDGISGATITVMVVNSTVMRSARAVATARGIVPPAVSNVVPEVAPEAQARPASASEHAAPSGRTESQAMAEPAPTNEAPAKRSQESRDKPAQAHPASAAAASKPQPRAQPSEPQAPGRSSVALAPSQPAESVAPVSISSAVAMALQEDEPMWIGIWRNRVFEITVLVLGLATLFVILIFQDWLARRPKLLKRVRYGFHVYSLFFLGWYGLAQLSVINVLTFTNSVMGGFRWEHFLIDPMLFILWGFVAMTLLLWGRGVYCGWLCPFGALQELILVASRKLKLPQFEFSNAVHERLVALKYILLILLFGVSLQSIAQAAWFAEVEPFKTVIAMRFQRDWQYVLYAMILIGLAAVNRKFYCKYLCPLGAALAIPGRFRLFEWWLRRRKECGKPCQVCASQCPVRAIRPTGEINANECHYCLDCQVIYYDDKTCPPLIERRKRREQRLKSGGETGKTPSALSVTAVEH